MVYTKNKEERNCRVPRLSDLANFKTRSSVLSIDYF